MSAPNRVDNQPAYILHARAYRETSELLEVFTADFGRIGLVARGARRPKSAFRGVLSPFQPIHIAWSGRGELATLRSADSVGSPGTLAAGRVMSGFYVNELLIKLLHRHDAHPELFMHYASVVSQLCTDAQLEPLLRGFELELLREIGYALNLENDAINHEPLQDSQLYEFRPAQGAVPVAVEGPDGLYFSGADLLAIGRLQFESPSTLKSAKRLLRTALNYHIGENGLKTRKVAAAMKR